MISPNDAKLFSLMQGLPVEGSSPIGMLLLGETEALTLVEFFEGVKQGDTTVYALAVNQWLVPAVIAIGVMLLGYMVATYLSRVSAAPIRKRVDETLGKFVGKLIYYGTMLAFAGIVLHQVGVEVGTVATILTAAGFAVGLAFQGTLSNFAAGIMLMVFRPFKVGDFVKAAGVDGVIDEIDLFSTTFDTLDHRRIIVPNGAIFGGTIENVSYHAERRVDVEVGVDYSADLQRTRDALQHAATSLEQWNIPGEGRGFQIVMTGLGDSAVNWVIRFWCTRADYWTVRELLLSEVKNCLDEAGIGIPFPQMDVHLIASEAAESEQPTPSPASIPAGAPSGDQVAVTYPLPGNAQVQSHPSHQLPSQPHQPPVPSSQPTVEEPVPAGIPPRQRPRVRQDRRS